MRFLIFIISFVVFVPCNSQISHPEYVKIYGKIINARSKEIFIYGMPYQKKIVLNEDGSFKDTLKVRKGKHQLMLMEDQLMSSIYIENGKEIIINANVDDFLNTLKYKLDFADYNSYLREKEKIFKSEAGFQDIWYREIEAKFNANMLMLKNTFENTLSAYPDISEANVNIEKEHYEMYLKRLASKYDDKHKYAVKLSKGKVSPSFDNYENFDGSKTSLSDFKGSYVYIDVWATWCGPCKVQIPFLEEIEKEYHDKNIKFVTISVDKQKDHDKWKDMVENKKMSRIQLIAPHDFSSEFVKNYGINAIPRFILIDPQGNIVDHDTNRPSDPELKNRLNSIL